VQARSGAALAGVWLAAVAQAQEAPELDVHGSTLPPPVAGSPLASFTPVVGSAGSWSVGGALELADGVLVAKVGEETRDELGSLAGVDLGGRWQLGERIGAGLTLPLWLSSTQASEERGPTLGDAWLWAPVSLVLPSADGRGFGLLLVPSLGLPTGNALRLLGDRGLRPGLLLVPGVGLGPVELAATVGVQAGASTELSSQTLGGPSAAFGGSASVDVGSIAVAGELRGGVALRTQRTAADAPVEARLSVSGRFGDGWAAAGAGHGLTRGIGSPAVRLLVAGGYSHGKDATSGPKPIAVEPTVEGAPVAFPVALRVQDQAGQTVLPSSTATSLDDPARPPVTSVDGTLLLPVGRWSVEISAPGSGVQTREIAVAPGSATPLDVVLLPAGGTGSLALRVADPEQQPVAGARVLIDGQPVGVTGAGGDVSIASLPPGHHAIVVRSDAFTEDDVDVDVTATGETALPIALQRVPGSVRVAVRGPDGAPVADAVLRFDGPRRLAPTPVEANGERLQVLGPGEWTLLVTSAKYGFQERAIDVPQGASKLIDVEVILRPAEDGTSDLLVRVIGPEGEPVDGAQIALDGQSLGRTSTGGQLRVQRLDTGTRALSVEAPWHLPAELPELELETGYQEQVVVLDWVEGATRVIAHTPTAAVPDAVVHFTGPEPTPSAPLGASGSGMYELAPGDWTVLVTSSQGFSESSLSVPKGAHHLFRVDALLGPSEEGTASLVVHATDPDGRAIEGASVALDGETVGSTANTGAISLAHLDPGERSLEVTAPPLYEAAKRSVTLESTPIDAAVQLGWAAGTAEIRVTDPAGAPIRDAVIRVDGPTRIPPTPGGPSGEAKLALGAGSWEILVTSATRGFAEQALSLTAADRMKVVPIQMEPVAAGRTDLLVRIRDPDGKPVPGAKIDVAGQVATTAGGGSALLSDLSPGAVSVRVSAPGFEPTTLETEIDEGSEERFAELAWIPRSLEVSVTDPDGKPVDAEISLVGPEDRPVVRTGPDGLETLSLRPGAWQVIAATEALGPSRADVAIGAEPTKVALKLEPTRVEVTGATVTLKEQVPFDFDRATLRSDSAPILRQVANTLLSRPGLIKVEVQGHTDDLGTVAYNQALSQARAEAVLRALVDLGVPQEKLVAVGYGNQRPVVANDTEGDRAQNRRVAFEILEQSAAP
jgi:outer membrane protein OmpA-like peptidoglycan-associated protein